MERFGYDDKTKPLTSNGDTEVHQDDEWEKELVSKSEATEFRGAVARVNFLSQDSPFEFKMPARRLHRVTCRGRGGARNVWQTEFLVIRVQASGKCMGRSLF